MSGIQREQWMRALEEAGLDFSPGDQDAITSGEFAAMIEQSVVVARRKLEALVQAGKATKTFKRATVPGGRVYRLPAYKLIETNPAKGKAR